MTKYAMSVTATLSFFLSGYAPADCPTDRLNGLVGTFKGVLSAVDFQGQRLPLEGMSQTVTVTGSDAFIFDIHYSDLQTGVETRHVKFTGQWDKTRAGFVLGGALLHGVLRVVRQGRFAVDFDTEFAGAPAHCDEMITVTNHASQVVRSVHCFAGESDGSSLGVRTAFGSRVP